MLAAEASKVESWRRRENARRTALGSLARSFACPPSPDAVSASYMMRSASAGVGLLLVALFAAACASKFAAPTPVPAGTEAPVALRNLEVTTVDGHRAVLLRLSRPPTLVRESSSKNPGSITILAWGPPGSADLPERAVPQLDSEIREVRVSRRAGALQVVLEFKGAAPPPYSVHQMADWIMVRLGAPQEG
jgi:hypothetical protein